MLIETNALLLCQTATTTVQGFTVERASFVYFFVYLLVDVCLVAIITAVEFLIILVSNMTSEVSISTHLVTCLF